MRQYFIQTVQNILRKRYRKTIAELLDPFEDMRRLLAGQSVSTIIDGGAYEGVISRRLANLFPAATVFAFEPSGSTFGRLEKNVRNGHHIKPFRLGLSSASRNATLYVNVQDSTNALSLPAPAGERYQSWQTKNLGSEEVSLVTLDEWAEREAVDGIDILKLDLQGHELEALKGADRLLRSSIRLVYTEVEFVRVYRQNCLYHEVAAFLADRGFELFQLYDLSWGEDHRLVCGDAIFIAREGESGA